METNLKITFFCLLYLGFAHLIAQLLLKITFVAVGNFAGKLRECDNLGSFDYLGGFWTRTLTPNPSSLEGFWKEIS